MKVIVHPLILDAYVGDLVNFLLMSNNFGSDKPMNAMLSCKSCFILPLNTTTITTTNDDNVGKL